MTGLELTIERSYQTHFHNIHFKITGLIRRFSRRNRSSSRIHCCYIIIGTEFKLTCFVVQSSALSGLKGKKCLSFSPWEPQTPLSSLGTLEFLSTCLGIDSLTIMYQIPRLLRLGVRHRKEWNIGICSNMMDLEMIIPSQRKTNIHLYVASKKGGDTSELIYKTEIDSQSLKTKLWLPNRK